MPGRFLLPLVLIVGVALVLLVARRRSTAPVRKADVTIQDGKTIDFSTGQPVVKDDPTEKQAIERSVAQMDAAAASVTFAPTATSPATASTTTSSTASVKK